MAIKVRLKTFKNGKKETIHPETDWSVVLNRPSITVGKNGETWSNGSSIRLDGNRIYVKDYLRDEVLLENYPINVKWSAVQNRPSITVSENTEAWSKSGSSIRLSENKIYIKDKNSNYEVSLENYPIKWSAISEGPDYLPQNQKLTTFGRYVVPEPSSGNEKNENIYPAMRECYHHKVLIGSEETYEYTYYYLAGIDEENKKAIWEKFDDRTRFTPGL